MSMIVTQQTPERVSLSMPTVFLDTPSMYTSQVDLPANLGTVCTISSMCCNRIEGYEKLDGQTSRRDMRSNTMDI